MQWQKAKQVIPDILLHKTPISPALPGLIRLLKYNQGLLLEGAGKIPTTVCLIVKGCSLYSFTPFMPNLQYLLT